MPLKGFDTEFQDILPDTPLGVCGSATCFIINFILLILFFPCTVTQLGQFKIGILRNKVTGSVDLDTSYEPGRYWIGFWKEFIEFPSVLNTIEFSDEAPEAGVQNLQVLRSRDRDGKLIKLDISVQYLLAKENLGKIYKEMLLGYEDLYISELRDAFAKAANLFPVQDAWLDYPSVTKVMREKCEAILKERHAECWGVQVWGVALTAKYEEKLTLTQVRKQAVKTEIARKIATEIRVKTQVLLSEYRKNVTIIRSGGEAEKYQIERAAYALAEANVVTAQAKSLQIARDRVCPDYAKESDVAGYSVCNRQNWVMDSKKLIGYQKMVMLKAQNSSQVIYNMKGDTVKRAANVAASRNLIHGRARRLGSSNSADAHDKVSEPRSDHEL